jgi:hypothetical protein
VTGKTYYRISSSAPTSEWCHRGHVSALWSGGDDDLDSRAGVSACESLEDLAEYFGTTTDSGSVARAADLDDCVIVAFRGDLSDDTPWETTGEVLIHPTEIVSVSPVADIMDAITACAAESIGLVRGVREIEQPATLRYDGGGYWSVLTGGETLALETGNEWAVFVDCFWD